MFSITTHSFQLAAGLFAVTALAGCGGNREAQLIGTWKADAASLQVPTPAPGSPAANPMAQQMAKNMLANTSLEIKEDKNFTLNLMFPMEGTWTFADDKLQLKMTKVMGMDMSKMPNANKNQNQPMVLNLSGDGKKLTMENPSGAPSPGGALVFVKP